MAAKEPLFWCSSLLYEDNPKKQRWPVKWRQPQKLRGHYKWKRPENKNYPKSEDKPKNEDQPKNEDNPQNEDLLEPNQIDFGTLFCSLIELATKLSLDKYFMDKKAILGKILQFWTSTIKSRYVCVMIYKICNYNII